MKKRSNLILVCACVFMLQACFSQNESQNKYGFDFIDEKISDVVEMLKKDSNSFWSYNEEIDEKGIKTVLIIKKGKTKVFDGYGSIKSRKGKIFEVVFYLDNKYRPFLMNSLTNYPKESKQKWKGKKNSFICFIEDKELKESDEFGFSISLDPCDGSQRD